MYDKTMLINSKAIVSDVPNEMFWIFYLLIFQRKDGYNYECEVMQLFEFGSLHHDYYLVNIRVPVEPYKGVNMGIGKLTGMTLVVCIIFSLKKEQFL